MGMPIPEKLPATSDSNLSIAQLHHRYNEIKAEADKVVNSYLDTLESYRAQPMRQFPENAGPQHIFQGISHERSRMSSIASRTLILSTIARTVQMDASVALALGRADEDGIRQVNENGLTQ